MPFSIALNVNLTTVGTGIPDGPASQQDIFRRGMDCSFRLASPSREGTTCGGRSLVYTRLNNLTVGTGIPDGPLLQKRLFRRGRRPRRPAYLPKD